MGLFGPAWQSENPRKAIKAINKLTDQNTLSIAAQEAASWNARLAAFDRLTDQQIIEGIIMSNANPFIRMPAVERLTDQRIISSIAKNDKDGAVRLSAVKILTDQLALEYVAANDTFDQARSTASIKLNTLILPHGTWSFKRNGGSVYYSYKADSLFVAGEILKKLVFIQPQTYYMVDTPDGTLGRDANGFFTEKPIKIRDLTINSTLGEVDSIKPQSLTMFGETIKNQSAVAHIKANGQYAKLILMMKCGKCGYESPIETEEGDFERQCYSCGTINKAHRAKITVNTTMGIVEI